MHKEVKLTEEFGFCYGVKRALEIAQDAMEKGTNFDTLGQIIHNPNVVQSFEELGVNVINDPAESSKDAVLVRSHGVPKDIMEKATKLGKKILDTTCPFVQQAHRAAEQLYRHNYTVLIVGKEKHPEVIGILSYTENKAHVVSKAKDIIKLNLRSKKVGIVAQTTMRLDPIKEVISAVLNQSPREIKFINTRCSTTERRQIQTAKLAREVEIMVIIGGKNSSNTKRLFEIAKKMGAKTYLIEHPRELKAEWFKNIHKVGITGGASTPPEHVLQAKTTIEKILQGG